MKLKKIAITNYRQFQNAVINFDDELTILAGANNSGKKRLLLNCSKEFLKIRIFQKRIFQQSTTQSYSMTLYLV